MTEEEIKAYVDKIEKTPFSSVRKILPSSDLYNIDVSMSKICEALAENVNILRRLNNENGKHELDEDINALLKKYYICLHYLDDQTEITHDISRKGHRVIFAKTPAGNPYFKVDLNDVPREVYGEVKNTLEGILNGIDMSDKTKFKYYAGSDYSQKILEFKGYQVRIYTTKLKGNILCVIGLDIKKTDWEKKISEKLKNRLSMARKQIESLRKAMNNPEQQKELLLDSEVILDGIMDTLNRGFTSDSDEIEMLFPSDEELEKLVPYDEEPLELEKIQPEVEVTETLEVASKEEDSKSTISVPSTSKKVKKRTRGLGKKTIARNEITASLKGLTLEELMKIQNFITKLKMDKGLSDTIGSIYEGFLNMSDDQTQEFESGIKDFKHDNIGRSR